MHWILFKSLIFSEKISILKVDNAVDEEAEEEQIEPPQFMKRSMSVASYDEAKLEVMDGQIDDSPAESEQAEAFFFRTAGCL